MEVRSTIAEVPRLIGRRRKRRAQFDAARPRQREPRRAQRKRVFGDKRNGGVLVLEADSTQGEITRKDIPPPPCSLTVTTPVSSAVGSAPPSQLAAVARSTPVPSVPPVKEMSFARRGSVAITAAQIPA